MWCKTSCVSLLLCSLLLGGCAAKGIDGIVAKQKVRDARAQRIKGYPGMRTDAALTGRLEAALRESDLAQARAHAHAFVNGACELASQTLDGEIARLSDAVKPQVQALRDEAEPQWQAQRAALTQAIDQAQSPLQLHRVLEPIHDGIETPVAQQGRLLRALPAALFTLPSAITVARMHHKEWRGELDAPFEQAVRFNPSIKGSDDERLARYAPVIVQEWLDEPPYPPTSNRFGAVSIDEQDHPWVDGQIPTVYAYSRRILLNGREHLQLTYTHWYPEHPRLKRVDPEAGRMEGVTLRITLDAQERPAIFETLYNCGCYHRVYPTGSLESAIQRECGDVQKDKKFAIERRIPGKIDMIVPKLVDDSNGTGRPIIRCRAGWHAIVDVSFDEARHANEVKREESYTLRPYDELERLPHPRGGVTSLFYDNGLVRDAQRLEGVFFVPIGMLSAGQPRQRGTQLIHWDHHEFDDPNLLAKTLRLPSEF